MTTRFQTVAGFLAAGVLLSGSAFAFAPEFVEDLPTVIITDKLPEVQQSGVNVYDVNGQPSPTTEYVFRFSAAIDARDYFGNTDQGLNGNDFAQVKFLFTEHNYDSNAGPTLAPNPAGTLMLNGETAEAAVPTESSFTGAPLLNSRYTAADGVIDFRNIDFSGQNEAINSGFTGIGSVTGQDITASDTQQRWVQLYLQGNTTTDIGTAKGGFLVITTTDGEDSTTVSTITDPWNPIYTANTFGGWASASQALVTYSTALQTPQSSQGLDFVSAGTFTGGSTSSSPASPAAPGTPSLTLSHTGTTTVFSVWAVGVNESGITLAANSIHRLRANIYSNNASTRDALRVRFGSQFSSGSFNYVQEANGPTLPTATNNELFAYAFTKASEPAQIFFDLLSVAPNLGGQQFTLNSVEISSADTEALGTPTVILNRGGAVTPASGETRSLPAGAPTPFLTTGTTVGESVQFGFFPTTKPTVFTPTSNVTTSALSVTIPANHNGSGFARFAFTPGSVADPATPKTFVGTAGKLYVVDVWARTSTPASTVFPDMRPNLQAAVSVVAQTQTILDAGNPWAIGAQDRAYSLALLLQNGTESWTTANVDFQIDFISAAKQYAAAANLTISRIVIREYEANN